MIMTDALKDHKNQHETDKCNKHVLFHCNLTKIVLLSISYHQYIIITECVSYDHSMGPNINHSGIFREHQSCISIIYYMCCNYMRGMRWLSGYNVELSVKRTWFKSSCCCFKAFAILFTPHCLSCTNEYLDLIPCYITYLL